MMEKKDYNKDLERLYGCFSEEMEKIQLPTEEELRVLLDCHDAASDRPPLTMPAKRHPLLTGRLWRYAAAAAVVLAAASIIWLAVDRPAPHTDLVAQRPDSGAIETVNDSLSLQCPPTDVPRIPARLIAGMPVVSDSSLADSLPEMTAPMNGLQIIVDVQQDSVTAPIPQQPVAPLRTDSDSTAPGVEPGRVDELPERPTIRETESLNKKENDQKALKNKKKKGKRNKKESYIEKRRKSKERINVIVPTQTPSMHTPTPHYIPTGTGGQRVIYY